MYVLDSNCWLLAYDQFRSIWVKDTSILYLPQRVDNFYWLLSASKKYIFCVEVSHRHWLRELNYVVKETFVFDESNLIQRIVLNE